VEVSGVSQMSRSSAGVGRVLPRNMGSGFFSPLALESVAPFPVYGLGLGLEVQRHR
jgi:hypothetical protein